LEHTPNPASCIKSLLALLKPGGLLVAHTPNGSAAVRTKESGFNQFWGQVHPVLLTDRFVQKVAGNYPYFVTSVDNSPELESWDQQHPLKQSCDGPGLFFAIRKLSD
jgi:hypothetical protein